MRGGADDDAALVGGGRRYPLAGLLAATRDLSPGEAERRARAHVDSLLIDDVPDVDVSALDAYEIRKRIRTRLLRTPDVREGEPPLTYARPFAEGLVIALCLDMPHTVLTLDDAAIADRAEGMDELFELGQRNTDLEPIDESSTLPGGVRLFVGDSLFIASKASHLSAVVDVPEQGVVFAVPHRHLLLAVPLAGPASLGSVQHLLSMPQSILRDPAPGGPISSDLYFARGGTVSRITGRNQAGDPTIVVTDDFHRALEELAVGET